jgi:hypothetical protein
VPSSELSKKFKMTLTKNNRINNQEKTKVFFWCLILSICLCVFSYGYLVRTTIVNIVTRENMEKELALVSSKVLSLESEYVKVKNNVTLEQAQNSGFIQASNQKFVTKTNTGSGFSVNIR